MVLASDCIYLESCFQPLLDTLEDLSFDYLIIAYKKRWKRERLFWQLCKKRYTVVKLCEFPQHDFFSRQRISLFCCVKKGTQQAPLRETEITLRA